MTRKSLEERIAQLEAQKKTLKARLAREERAKDTRRKILLGALILDRLQGRDDDMATRLDAWLRRELPGFLTREVDKDLFTDLLTDKGTETGRD